MTTEGGQDSEKREETFKRSRFVSVKGLLLRYHFLHTAKMVLLRDILTGVARIPF